MRRGQCVLSYSGEDKDKDKDKDTQTSKKNVLLNTGLGKTLATKMRFQTEFCQVVFHPPYGKLLNVVLSLIFDLQ